MSYTITFPSRRAFVEWRLRELAPEVEQVRQGHRCCSWGVAAASVGLLLAIWLGWGDAIRWTFLSVEIVFAAVWAIGFWLHRGMQKEFQSLCHDRLWLLVQEAHEVEERRYEELARRMSSRKDGEE